MRKHLVAVDIGTASARAGLFDEKGTLIVKAAFPIAMLRPAPGHAEHDSDDIWQAVCLSVRAVLKKADLKPADIAAIGFDATCSLVVRGPNGEKSVLSRSEDKCSDTIVWLDHRAHREARELSQVRHPLVSRTGGRFSPEMAVPKLMWLKRNRPDLWQQAGLVLDLSDFATYRATGINVRSCSPLISKWGYSPDAASGWDKAFLNQAGLADLAEGTGVSDTANPLGQPIGTLCKSAAEDLGLDTSCLVAPGMIDAYAGVLGLLGSLDAGNLQENVALIAGTSSCLAWLSRTEIQPLESYWGPFRDVAVPGLWLMEGGQSAAGALLDHMVRMHASGGEPTSALHDRIIERIGQLKVKEGEGLGHPMDVLPDFHGNRSPLGDPEAWGIITGLSLDSSFDGLCRVYWRTAVGIACGIRHILEKVEETNGTAATLHIAGGHAKNPLLVALYSDVTGRPMAVPRSGDPVLLGTAMNAAASAGFYGSIQDAARAMAPERVIHYPDPARRRIYEQDYRRHLLLTRHRAELQALYESA